MFCLKLFQLAISLLFSNFILFIVQTANSKYESWWKLLMEVYQWINMIISVIQVPRLTLCFAWSYFNLPFTLIFKFHMSSTFHLIYCTNCKFKVRKLVKAINISVSMDYHDNNGHPIFKSNILFCLKLFQLAISLLFSNFILFIVQTANSKYESWWKLLMEVYQWINMIISVIQVPRLTLCLLEVISTCHLLLFSNFICPQLFIIFIVQNANSKYESWWKLLT